MSMILFADDEEHLRHAAGQTFQLAELPVQLFSGAEALLEHVTRDFDGIVVTDIRMPGLSGLELLERIQKQAAHIPVVVMTAHTGLDSAVASNAVSDSLTMLARRVLEALTAVSPKSNDVGVNSRPRACPVPLTGTVSGRMHSGSAGV